MKIIANTKNVMLVDVEELTSGSYNDIAIDLELSREYEGLTTFVTFNKQKVPVIAGQVFAPTLKSGLCTIGVYAIDVENDEIVLRYSPVPTQIFVKTGTYSERLNDAQAPTQTEAEKIYALIDKAIEDGKLKGDTGEQGEQGIQGEKGDTGESAYEIAVRNGFIGTEQDWIDFYQERLTAGFGIDVNSFNQNQLCIDTDVIAIKDEIVKSYNDLEDLLFSPLALSSAQATPLSTIPDGAYIVTQRGVLSTSKSTGVTIGVGALMIVGTSSGIKRATLQTSGKVYVFNDNTEKITKSYFITNDEIPIKAVYINGVEIKPDENGNVYISTDTLLN
jgi:hypothetical protein